MNDPVDEAIVRAVAAKCQRDGGQKSEDFLRAVTAKVTAGKLMAMCMPDMPLPAESERIISAYNNVMTSTARRGSSTDMAARAELEGALAGPVTAHKAAVVAGRGS